MRMQVVNVLTVVGVGIIGLVSGGCGPETDEAQANTPLSSVESSLDTGTVVQISCTGSGPQGFSLLSFTLPGSNECSKPYVGAPPTPADTVPPILYAFHGCATIKIGSQAKKSIIFQDNTNIVVRHIQGTAQNPTLSIYAVDARYLDTVKVYNFNFQNGTSTLQVVNGTKLTGTYTSTCQLAIW